MTGSTGRFICAPLKSFQVLKQSFLLFVGKMRAEVVAAATVAGVYLAAVRSLQRWGGSRLLDGESHGVEVVHGADFEGRNPLWWGFEQFG
jgi:hypothetical protein